MTKLRRTMLFVPGNNTSMVVNAGIYPVDSLMFDLEDSVSLDQKDNARFVLHEALKTINYQNKELIVRINSLSNGMGQTDLDYLIPLGKVAIRLPKTDSSQDIIDCESYIEKIEKRCGMKVGTTKMMAAIESANGVLNAYSIAHASKRLIGIALGAEDLVTDLHTRRSPGGLELSFARSMILMAARSAGISAIDTVFSDLNDMEGFRSEVEMIKQLGFDGKSIINPRQIETIVEIFSPTEKEIIAALEIVDVMKEAAKMGKGVVSLHGKMVDKPIIERAKRVLETAKVTGQLARIEDEYYE
ncbi:MAG: aldolase/citrate lyase family protein [Sphaerochaetaceae bacterium]|jgi:citrate lyase subunit beta/citryl-CoA lyase|nr:aldolase/citrate lyase family protein [Sphaerochaetaceae bacterium]